MDDIVIKELINASILARKNSYCPYSHFAVGAACYTGNGKIYSGCNIENASYPVGICAERCAVSKAVSEGDRKILAVAIAGGQEGGEVSFTYPCGFCRQFLREFNDPDKLEVIVATSTENYKVHKLSELLPESFGPENLG